MKRLYLAKSRKPLMWLIMVLAVASAPAGVSRAHAEKPDASLGLSSPSGVAVDARGNVFVADTGNGRIVELSPLGRLLAIWNEYGSGFSSGSPYGVAVDRFDNVYVADLEYDTVLKYSSRGHLLAQWGTSGDGEFSSPQGVAVGGRGNVFVANSENNTIEKLSPDGYVLDTWSVQTPSCYEGDEAASPLSVALDRAGNVYATVHSSSADCGGYQNFLQKRASDGSLLLTRQWLADLGGVAVGGRGNVFMVMPGRGSVYKLTPDGWGLTEMFTNESRWGPLRNPSAVTVDSRGSIFVADTDNNRIVKLASNGRVLAVWS